MLIIYGFILIAGLSFLIIFNRLSEEKRRIIIRHLTSERVKDGIRKTEPAQDVYQKSTEFCKRKLRMTVLIICAGAITAFAVELAGIRKGELLEGNLIKRNPYMGTEKKLRLKVREEASDEPETIDIQVSEMKYGTERLMEMAKEADGILMEKILKDNGSVDHIETDMYFPASLEGFPFIITWRTDDPLLISSKGTISEERLKKLARIKNINEGILTGIHAELGYEDFLYEMDFSIRIYQKKESSEYTLGEYVKLLAGELDEDTREDEYLELPDRVEDTPVIYEEAGDNKSMVILIMVLIAAAAMYFREDQELQNRVKKRDRELMSDYPRLVNRFVLFYSAGLTTRGIWSKLCRDYLSRVNNGGDRRYLYEEMLICEGRMNEGMGELMAYEGFAARCGLNKYRQFISLIGQAMGRGRADLMPMLEMEAREAFCERKDRARELGEEAGTRLLFPMLMMLFVVLVIVMVPAFIAFRM